jgi:hypothetical protein
MERNIEQCPMCQNYTEGKPVFSQARQVTRAAVKKGSSQIIGAVIGFVVGFCFGIVGCVPGSIIGYFIGLLVSSSKTISEVTDSIDQQLYSSTEFQFDCPRCGYSWRRFFQNGTDTIPDSVIARQQADLVRTTNESANSNFMYAVIWGIITLACIWYCFTTESSSKHMEKLWLVGEVEVIDVNWLWFILAFFAFVFSLITIWCLIDAINKKREANRIEEMTVSDFRTSSYRQ